MEPFKFKKLEIEQEGSWLKRLLKSPHFKKTIVYAAIGASIGYVLFIIEQDAAKLILWSDTAMQNVLMGMAFGVFITNSPCARGKC
ncbi:hypothetical protein KDU71_07965 [Carboxylicivirga sediminis]|uniref:Uncharacterized protein n=1 Tax=Carboxylicivirga sediminis TaxID=2006564 RepID=A0A941F2C7_9BACT|nr:hypothetical protein [Carboxylicivirga sediminis]MBR8535491.1 hypothetical protein [Carboxylicivirga sediminis]